MKPVILTRASWAAGAAASWRRERAHYIAQGHRLPGGRTDAEVADLLDALGPSPDPDDVDRVIGHDGWTQLPACSGCDAHVPLVVQVGEVPDYESSTAYLCPACLREAAALLGVAA